MPKKFTGENSKSAAAKARKDATKDTVKAKQKQADEDAQWVDDDKGLVKKQQKKEEAEKKRLKQLERKAESNALIEEEMDSIKKATKIAPERKKTRAEIESYKTAPPKKTEAPKIETHLDVPLEENINQVIVEGEEARTITDAINILSVKDEEVDKHPEKRMKALYTAYEVTRLAELKIENPSLRLSQLKQMVFKDWQKSPENPLNKF